ncbi:BrnT family toxin [Rugamonas sp. CCM 8940]|uniref:BrnT family toxin n=1 Tax=Rugamonas sp. CCM 8940 TaxID=2765359 RepID=UPI0018F7A81C|nr:BrnT family toxin [Rugamonas sp. CCM 8940]
MRFEWDPHKARTNLRKHGVSFDEATSVFDDKAACFLADVAHSDVEDRCIIVGTSATGRVLLVCYCWRGEELARIFSARKPTSFEVLQYL